MINTTMEPLMEGQQAPVQSQDGPQATQPAPLQRQLTYEEVEQELAVCKLVLYNTYTADVLADLLKMYATLVPQALRQQATGVLTKDHCVLDNSREASTCSSCSTQPAQQSRKPTVSDASTQTATVDEGGVGVPTHCSDSPLSTVYARWDLMFYNPCYEADFCASFNSLSAATDVLQCGLLLCVLALSSFRQSNAHTLFATLIAMLVGMAVIAGNAVRAQGAMHVWYIRHREALVLCLRTMLVVSALPAGQALLGRAQQPSTVLTNIALWAVPALTMRVRLSIHLVFQLAVLCAMLAMVACQHAMNPAHGRLHVLFVHMGTLITCGFIVPSCVLYTTEERNRLGFLRWGGLQQCAGDGATRGGLYDGKRRVGSMKQ